MFSTPDGENGIHLINLDARYGRSPTWATYGSCVGSKSRMLSDQQWAWLEEELLTRVSEIKIIGSGTQVLPPTYRERTIHSYCAYDGPSGTFEAANTEVGEPIEENWRGTKYEAWSEIPQDRTRLLLLCQRSINEVGSMSLCGNLQHCSYCHCY
jgi:alkaline phosphatase D